jgi:hypothetical protein
VSLHEELKNTQGAAEKKREKKQPMYVHTLFGLEMF